MILSQLVDADELKVLSPDDLRDMLSTLDDEVVYGKGERPEEGSEPAAEKE